MKRGKWFNNIMKEVENDFDYRLERMILELTESICQRMGELPITRSQLASKLNVSPAAVTKILDGNSNFTLKTLLSLSDALDSNLKVEFDAKKHIGRNLCYLPKRKDRPHTSTTDDTSEYTYTINETKHQMVAAF